VFARAVGWVIAGRGNGGHAETLPRARNEAMKIHPDQQSHVINNFISPLEF
jgi:hypothetical protein